MCKGRIFKKENVLNLCYNVGRFLNLDFCVVKGFNFLRKSVYLCFDVVLSNLKLIYKFFIFIFLDKVVCIYYVNKLCFCRFS